MPPTIFLSSCPRDETSLVLGLNQTSSSQRENDKSAIGFVIPLAISCGILIFLVIGCW